MDVVINSFSEGMPSAANALVSEQHYLLNTLAALGADRNQLPLASLLKRYHQLEGSWLIASPISWEATHNDAMLVAAGASLQLDDKLARVWFAEVSQFFASDGMQLVYHDATTWLVNVSKKPPIVSQSPFHLLHQSFMPLLEALDPSMYWQRLITELQMFMGSHPLNYARPFPINGLWFWGNGELPVPTDKPLLSDDEVIRQVFPYCQAFDATSTPPKEALVIIAHSNPELISQFKTTTAKMPVNWYWNNLAYHSKAQRWWTKLWRK